MINHFHEGYTGGRYAMLMEVFPRPSCRYSLRPKTYQSVAVPIAAFSCPMTSPGGPGSTSKKTRKSNFPRVYGNTMGWGGRVLRTREGGVAPPPLELKRAAC